MDIHATGNVSHIQSLIAAAIEAGTARGSQGMAPIAIQLQRHAMSSQDAENDIESFAVHIAIQLSQAEADAAAASRSTVEQSELDLRCPSMHYRKSMGDTRCCICLNDFKPNRRVRRLPCGHLFCSVCVTQWLVNESPTCPTCRTDISG